MNPVAFVLRKINGRFDACTQSGGKPRATALRSAPSLLRAVSLFAAVLLVPLLLVAALAGAVFTALHGTPAHLALHGASPLIGLAAIGQTTDGKGIVEELKSTFEQFKSRDAQRETELKKLGEATSETMQALKAWNERLDQIEVKFERSRVANGLSRIDDDIREGRNRRSFEVKAFAKWARRGDRALSGEEVKSLSTLSHFDGEETKALETDSSVEGGVFVPQQLANRVIEKLILVSQFRRLASVENISSTALEIPAEGTTNFASGWTGEQVAISVDGNVVRWLAPLEAHGQMLLVTEEDTDHPGCQPRDEAQHRCVRHAFRYTLRSIASSGQSELRYATAAGVNEGPCDFAVRQDGGVLQRSLRGTTHAEAHGGSTVTWAPARERTLAEDAHGRSFVVGPWNGVRPAVEGMPRMTGVQVVP